jgi:hypothetical protein
MQALHGAKVRACRRGLGQGVAHEDGPRVNALLRLASGIWGLGVMST